jgi:hypothetical protein
MREMGTEPRSSTLPKVHLDPPCQCEVRHLRRETLSSWRRTKVRAPPYDLPGDEITLVEEDLLERRVDMSSNLEAPAETKHSEGSRSSFLYSGGRSPI